jgi:hypothetical protein
MLLFVESMLWSIIGDSGFVVSSVVPSAQALLSFHILTGKMGTRPFGPKPKLTAQQLTHARALRAQGEPVPVIAALFKVHRATLYRALAD